MKASSFTRPPGKRFHLAKLDPGSTGKLDSKEKSLPLLEKNLERLWSLQNRLFAGGKHGLLVVLQAMDGGGKDGTIRTVMGAFSPQGVAVTPFKVPTEEERAHDFLWRIHKVAPAKGLVGIFNRSHYEDVLVVRVKGLAPEEVWRRRYEQINAFEQLLAETGTKIVKLYLHISPEEQARRLADRQQDPDEHWKFNPGDLEDRKLWPQYMAAYEDALSLCNTPWAPWYAVPADRKWYRNLVVSEILVEALESLHLEFPKPDGDLTAYKIPKIKWP
ncbi:MAG TPA: polyphosphate kinase 2 family protein [Thermoanaerobaculia bacterium]|nr:polyphosphate kinase 2 family protein [Thermoanaerobaculia bacterium]